MLNIKQLRKELETAYDALLQSELRYRALYEGFPDLCRTINTDGIILDCNESYAKHLGYSKQEITGKSIFAHTAEDSLDSMRESFETWKKGGYVRNKEVRLKRKDGSTFPVLVSATNLYDKNDNLIGSNTVIRDMSKVNGNKEKSRLVELELNQTVLSNKKQANILPKINHRLEKQNEKLKKEIADKTNELIKKEQLAVIGQLSSRLAHDMRNPLSIIKIVTEVMKETSSNLDEKSIERFSKIDRAISRMSHQIDDVLSFIRIKPLELDNTSVYAILDSAITTLKIPENIKIEKIGDNVTLLCDPKSIEVVFINLITNAIQALGEKGEIKIKIEDQTDWVAINVIDSGAGVPEDNLATIFDPLFTTKQSGTGLGLSSCKSMVEQHGGTIEVTNNPSTFIVRLPRKLSAELKVEKKIEG